MKKLYLSYLPPIFFCVVEKRSFVPRLAAFFHAHARCSECFSESPYIPPFIAPFLVHVSTILSMILSMIQSLQRLLRRDYGKEEMEVKFSASIRKATTERNGQPSERTEEVVTKPKQRTYKFRKKGNEAQFDFNSSEHAWSTTSSRLNGSSRS